MQMNEYSKNWHKVRYERLKEQGICPRCGKEKAKEGKIYCQICLGKMKSYSSQISIANINQRKAKN